jgi:mannosyl-3-phosphoglycerate phosphatase
MYIFFTDLDGTLIDHYTYSPEGALEGIELLKERGIPLVPVTSKTFDEVCEIMNLLNLRNDFVFENGAGLGIYSGSGGFEFTLNSPEIDYLLGFVPMISGFFGSDLNILNFVSAEELNRLTGLGLSRSELALKRKGSIFFIPRINPSPDEAEIEALNSSLAPEGVKITKGGRFYHLVSLNCGKGEGVKKIIEFYRVKYDREPVTAAAGDSLNDLDMLKVVDYSYVVKKPDTTWLKTDFPAIKTQGEGPYGFSEAVKDFLIRITG